MQMFTVEEAQRILSQKFLMQPGIVGVGSGGSLRVYIEDWSYAHMIPESILGYDVEVKVIGKLYTLQRVRPLVGGISVGSSLIGAGTLSYAIILPDGRIMLLSNRHVFYGPPGTPILSPAVLDGGRIPDDVVGYIDGYVEIKPPPSLNKVDIALATTTVQVLPNEIMNIGRINGVTTPTVGMNVKKYGRTTGLTYGSITDDHVSVKVYGYEGMEYALFEDCIMTTAMAKGGDSGSILITLDNMLVGLIFAGNDNVTVACKAINVQEALRSLTIQKGMPINLMGLAPLLVGSIIYFGGKMWK
jgi:hypothetical protein